MLASPAPAHANMRFKIGSWLGFIPSIKMGLEDFSLNCFLSPNIPNHKYF